MTKFIFNPEKPFSIPAPLGKNQCLSPSAINEFEQCNAKYLWNRIFKIEGEAAKTKFSEDGKKIHKWLEDYMPKNPTIEELLDKYSKEARNDYEKWIQNVLLVEHRYLINQGLEAMNVLSTEYKISSWVNRRVGYIDRIDIRPDGNLTVIDYKPKSPKKYPSNIRRQLTFYATQINFLIENELFDFDGFENSRVTHCRVIGYKDGSDWEFKLNKRSITALEKRVKAIRTQTTFLCKPGSPLCKYCRFVDNLCFESNLEYW